MSALKNRITDDIKTAMRASDKSRLGTLRQVSAAIKQVEVDERRALADADVLAVLSKMIKQRREALEAFEQAGRAELAAKERAELGVIQDYMPQPLGDAQLDRLIDTAVADTGAESVKDMGKVMATLKPRVQGRADMAAVSKRVKMRLSGT